MIERAIVQQVVVDRDGQSLTRDCPRPEHVRAMADRVQRWVSTREGCQLCHADNAVSVRAGCAVCGRCKANMETRLAGFEFSRHTVPSVRADNTDGMSGVAIVFDSLSVNLGGFFERIDPRAVDRTLAEGSDVLQLVDHDSSKPIGRVSAGTLRLRKTSAGLANTILDPPATTAGKDIAISVRRREITGQSFGFNTLADDWDLDGEIVVRTVLDMRFVETSIVTFPAYPATSIEMGSNEMRSVEFLRKVHRTRMAG